MKAWLTYIAAFICGLGAAYVVLRLGAEAMFADIAGLGFLISTMFPPLAGLALFALVYGLMAGRVLKGRFWGGGLSIVAGSYLIGALLLWSGTAALPTVAGLIVLTVFIGGWLLLGRVSNG
ncbi:MAG: hypothetical protein AAGA08_05590 [Pseudomonadota bacterium]